MTFFRGFVRVRFEADSRPSSFNSESSWELVEVHSARQIDMRISSMYPDPVVGSVALTAAAFLRWFS